MGIDVSSLKIVTYNPGHQQRVVTDIARSPPLVRLDNIDVTSIFRRQSVATDTSDGNPLIYALKGRRGYTLPYADFCSIYRCASIILAKVLPTIDYDVVVPIPSSSKVVEIFAKDRKSVV